MIGGLCGKPARAIDVFIASSSKIGFRFPAKEELKPEFPVRSQYLGRPDQHCALNGQRFAPLI
jgi:hypothetical protein